MTFASPYLLPLLLVVPAVAFVAWWLERRRARYAVAFTNLDLLASVVERGAGWRSLVPARAVPARARSRRPRVARPQATVSARRADRATVVLLVDVSGSMRANDVKPTRLLAAAHAMSLFAAEAAEEGSGRA